MKFSRLKQYQHLVIFFQIKFTGVKGYKGMKHSSYSRIQTSYLFTSLLLGCKSRTKISLTPTI
ncbi:Uncharacterised protein [Segatella buccae]|uniref:Uncharacterized protein n=1 Tax=Segatella buccae TaxID=28126 RepID=A0AAQ1ZJH0_9BACT|nr:Uncharacterised protein [Segatella buccae]